MNNYYNKTRFPLTQIGMANLLYALEDDPESEEGCKYLYYSFNTILEMGTDAKEILPDPLRFSLFRSTYIYHNTNDLAKDYLSVLYPSDDPNSASDVLSLLKLLPYDEAIRDYFCECFYPDLSEAERNAFQAQLLWRYWDKETTFIPNVNMDAFIEKMEQDGLLESPDIDVEMLQEDNCFSIDTIAKFVANRLKINLTAIIGRKRYFLKKKKKSARSILAYVLGFYFKKEAVMEFMTCTEDDYHRMLRGVCNAREDSNTELFIESIFNEIDEAWFH